MIVAPAAHACICIAHNDEKVEFTQQTNLIVWNPETKTEHFIRNAAFKSSAESMAFIAPTPTVPEMKAVDPGVFGKMEAFMWHAEHPPGPAPAQKPQAADGLITSAGPPAVQVVQEVEVAGYHAATLKADDSAALSQWLQDNDYPYSPVLQDWSKPYIQKGWFLTAFKVIAKGGAAETGVVRLSFQTDRPFNPYWVPAANAPDDGHREGLRLYFVSTAPYIGKIGGTDPWIQPRVAFTFHYGSIGEMLHLPGDAMPLDLVATCYDDPSFPRVDTDDLFFTQDSTVQPVLWENMWPKPTEPVQTFDTPPPSNAAPNGPGGPTVQGATATDPKGNPLLGYTWIAFSACLVGIICAAVVLRARR